MGRRERVTFNIFAKASQSYSTGKNYLWKFYGQIISTISKYHKIMENYTFPAVKDIFQSFVQSNNSKPSKL